MTTPNPKKILIVNDNRQEMVTLSQILLLNGYQLSYSENEALAIKLARKTKPDLVICNTVSTKLDVTTFFRAVRSSAETRHIPFLFIAESRERLLEQMGDLHPKHLLLKPFTREQLAITVQENLKR
jgi:response regulator RpfG family c-di-GMP phosphodiesterase